MGRIILVAAAVAAALTAVVDPPLAAQDAAAVAATAARAIGADRVTSIRYEATGSGFSLGQSINPSAPWPRFTVISYQRDIDVRRSVSRLQIATERADLTGGGLLPNGEQLITSASPWAEQVDLALTPHGFLNAAIAGQPTLATRRAGGKTYRTLTITAANRAPLVGYLNAQDLLERVETRLDNPILGDMPVEAEFSGYKDFGGVTFPTRIVQKRGGFPVWDLTIATARAQPLADPPAAGRGGGGRGGAAIAPSVQVERIGDGILFLTGGSHHSVAVAFDDFVAVIEAPLNEARSLAVIAAVKEQLPGKPIRYVINTHHHFDHSGGLRTFVEEGATVVTHQVNRSFYTRALAAPHTLNPDRLSQSKKAATIEAVADKKIITGGARTLELHLVRGNAHHDGLLMAYLPRERLLVEVDVFNPPAAATPPDPTTVNLLENVERLRLAVDSILSLHGRGKASKADLDAAAGRIAAK